jgi:nucleoside-diphosphate-sugar epimerase
MHVDDMAAACIHLLDLSPDRYWSAASDRCSHVNVGTGKDISIAELASLIASVTGFGGAIDFDATMPDGTPRKLLDVSRLRELGWEASIGLRDGIRQTHDWMAAHWQEITVG